MTAKTIRKTRRFIWLKDHLLEAIMVLMIGGFLTYYAVDRDTNVREHGNFYENFITIDSRLQTVILTMINDPDTDPEVKKILIEYLNNSFIKRSGTTQ